MADLKEFKMKVESAHGDIYDLEFSVDSNSEKERLLMRVGEVDLEVEELEKILEKAKSIYYA